MAHLVSAGPADLGSPVHRHAVHLVRTRLKAHGVHLNWALIRKRTANWVSVTTSPQTVVGSQICIWQGMRPDVAAFEISAAAGVVPRLHQCRMRSNDAMCEM